MKIIKSILFLFFLVSTTHAQTQLEPWGNLSGIKLHGDLLEFTTSICLADSNKTILQETGKEKQEPRFSHKDNKKNVITALGGISIDESVEDLSFGNARIHIKLNSEKKKLAGNIFFRIIIPNADNLNSNVKMNGLPYSMSNFKKGNLYSKTGQIEFSSKGRKLTFLLQEAAKINIELKRNTTNNDLEIFIPIHSGEFSAGEEVNKTISLIADEKLDDRPVLMRIDTNTVGSNFAGFGGNFRIQNPKSDSVVIDYCLNNMQVSWARVEMPWKYWQEEKEMDPIAVATKGMLHPSVVKALNMAKRLDRKQIPLILTAWFPPDWAIIGRAHSKPGPGEQWGNPLNYTNIGSIYKSIADYIQYLRDNLGVEIKFFSFNESDLGINIRQTGLEHAALIKGLGAYFKERGLKTKMLLGDNSDASTINFISEALHDTATHPFIGAISFHSWRGCDTETLKKWGAAAKQLGVPLIVGEGSIDAAAWQYPAIFEEPSYALQEINLYTRILAFSQPLSILQWQLTSDYSPLVGGGIYGDNSPLKPTQRFWNLKQLASTPTYLKFMPVSVDRPNISVAGLGNNVSHEYAIHLVNNGTTRTINISGLPRSVHAAWLYTTNKNSDMLKKHLLVKSGIISFIGVEDSYISLFIK